MSEGHPDRRTVLKMGGAALFGGLAGCSSRSGNTPTAEYSTEYTQPTNTASATSEPSQTGSTTNPTEEPPQPNVTEEWDFQRYLPEDFQKKCWSITATSANAVRQDRYGFGPAQTDAMLSPLDGKNGWITDDEIETQFSWEGEYGERIALNTSLSKSEIVSRYKRGYYDTSPTDTYKGYTIFTVPNAWFTANMHHAVGEEDVLICSTPWRSDLETFIDGSKEPFQAKSDVATALDVLDTRYDVIVAIPEQGATFDDSGIEFQAYCATFSPHMAGEGFVFTTGIVTSKPAEMMQWAQKKDQFSYEVLAYNDPEYRFADNLVLIEEIGTVNGFLDG